MFWGLQGRRAFLFGLQRLWRSGLEEQGTNTAVFGPNMALLPILRHVRICRAHLGRFWLSLDSSLLLPVVIFFKTLAVVCIRAFRRSCGITEWALVKEKAFGTNDLPSRQQVNGPASSSAGGTALTDKAQLQFVPLVFGTRSPHHAELLELFVHFHMGGCQN